MTIPCSADNYYPSDELLATFATLPAKFLSKGEKSQNTNPLQQEETSEQLSTATQMVNDHFYQPIHGSKQSPGIIMVIITFIIPPQHY
jgi:hypothetical protein